MMQERARLFRSLAVMQRAGLPLLQSLESLARQTIRPVTGQALERMLSALYRGASLRQATAAAAPLFDTFHQAVVALAEQTGDLGGCFEQLARREERRLALRQQIQGQLMYPLFVFASLLLFLLIGGPLLGSALPGAKSPGVSLWLGGAALIATFGRSGSLRARVRDLKPVRELRKALATAHFLQTWSGMLEQGVPLLLSLKLSAHASEDPRCAAAILEVAESLRSGAGLSCAFARSHYFPPLVKGCVSAGEECGSLPRFAQHLAGLYEMQVLSAIDALLPLLAPACLLMMGLVLLGSLLSTLQPLLRLVAQL